MLITTSDTIPGKEIKETLGLVQGQIVQSKHVGSDMVAGLKNIVGGEIKGYTDMVNKARRIAVERMVEEAEQKGADAIVCLRYGSSTVAANVSEILAYGTAVKLK